MQTVIPFATSKMISHYNPTTGNEGQQKKLCKVQYYSPLHPPIGPMSKQACLSVPTYLQFRSIEIHRKSKREQIGFHRQVFHPVALCVLRCDLASVCR